MVRILFSISFFLFCQLLFAQNYGSVTGVVLDADRQPLIKATVSIVAVTDSTVLSYSLTDDAGKFKLIRIPAQRDLLLYITHINSSPFHREIRLKAKEELVLDTIQMSGNNLDEVVVTQVAPIRLNGDTLEYKANYFKTRPNANVEELLQLLPGLQVNVDGTIYYQGKQVSAVRVNNKDFFAQDLTLATRNLDASLVDIIQVIKDKGDSKREILDDSELPIVINLKTKKEFVKADFGKFYGSGGTRDRYEGGALVNTFRDTLQISFIGYANNLSRQGFDYSELSQYGGMNRAENNSYSYMSYGGLQNKISLALNANYDIEKKLKTNLMYTFEQQTDYVNNKGISSNFYESITEIASNSDNSTYKNDAHRIRAFIRYTPDTTARISLESNVELGQNNNQYQGNSNTLRDDETQVREGENHNNSERSNNRYRYNFYAEKKFPRSKMLLSLTHSLENRVSQNDNEQNSFNRYYLFSDSTVNQGVLTWGNTNEMRIGNTVNLQIPIREEINWDWYTRYNWELNRNLESIDSKINADEYTSRDDVANNKQGRFGFLYLGTKANASLFKKKLKISLGIEWLDLRRDYHYYGKTADLNDNLSYWLPNVSLNYRGMTLSYAKYVRLPSFYQLIAVNSNLYPTSLTIASPYFNNQMEDNFSLRYYNWFNSIKLNVNASIGYVVNDYSIGSKRSYNVNSSESVYERYQAPGTDNLFANLHLMKRFTQSKSWNVSLTVSGFGSSNLSFNTVNGEENKARSFYGNLTNTLNVTYKNKVTVIPTYGIQMNTVNNARQTVNFRDITNVSHSIGAVFRLDDIKSFRLETAYTVKNQPQSLRNDRTNLHIVNASLYYPIMQRKGELKFTAFDILNQNQNIWMGGYGNTNYYQEQLTLRQYFMLGVVYKFLATPTK